MIGRLRGVLASKAPGRVLVDVGGVGYEVAVTPRALAELPDIGEEAVLHTHLHVREDVMAMFGFPTEQERDLFRLLLGASGVGPKVALAICATLEPGALQRAVMTDDVETLQTVPGIGKRSAQKLILELRPRLEIPDGDLPGSEAGGLAQVREALEGLGYQPSEIKGVLSQLPGEGPVEGLLRDALRMLGQR
jgi:Holliday junction DNA helicase RuvA